MTAHHLHPEVRLYRAVEMARRDFREKRLPLPETANGASILYGVDPAAVLKLSELAEQHLAEWRQQQALLNVQKYGQRLLPEDVFA